MSRTADPGAAGGGVRSPGVWAALIEAAPDGLLAVDADGMIVYANERLAVMSGHASVDLVGQSVEVLVPAALSGRHARLREAFTAEARTRLMDAGDPLWLQRRDGSRLPVEISLRPGLVDGRAVVLAAVRDVTHRRMLERRERLVTQALDVITDAVVVIEVPGLRRVYANQALLDLTGYTRTDFEDAPVWLFEPPRESARLREAAVAVACGKLRVAVLHTVAVHRNGAQLPLEVRITYRPDPAAAAAAAAAGGGGGPAAGHVILVARDIADRVAEERRRVQRTLTAEAIAEISTGVLAGQALQPTYDRVVRAVVRVFDAVDVALAVPGPGARPDVVAGVGTGVGATGLGPGARAGFGRSRDAGLLVARRAPGAEPFTPEEGELFSALARQLELAGEVDQARADRERLAVLEDRERIARDLHDTVIQDLIAVGLMLGAGLGGELDPVRRDHRDAVMDELEEAVRRLRASVFDLRRGPGDGTTTAAVLSIAAAAGRALGGPVHLAVTGSVDDLPGEVAGHVRAVLREALANVVRHADATTAWVTLGVGAGQLSLGVEDDGTGIPAAAVPGDGLTNLRHRADLLGGHLETRPRDPNGTRLEWIVPLRAPTNRRRPSTPS